MTYCVGAKRHLMAIAADIALSQGAVAFCACVGYPLAHRR
jgi:hypothetical protein